MASDQDLIGRCLAGDHSAFDEIVRRYQDPLFRHLLRLSGSPDQAEDLCQEAFIKFYHALPSFDGGRPVIPFLLKIASNLWRDGARPRLVLLGEDHLDSTSDPGRPDTEALDAIEHQAILQAMAGLRPEYREALSLRYDQGLSYREIADVTGASTGTVGTWLHRGLEALRDELQVARKEAAT